MGGSGSGSCGDRGKGVVMVVVVSLGMREGLTHLGLWMGFDEREGGPVVRQDP